MTAELNGACRAGQCADSMPSDEQAVAASGGKSVAVTVSWDDGCQDDLRMAELMSRYGILGTFYVAPKNVEYDHRQLLTDGQTAELARSHEVGAHTMRHFRLPTITDQLAQAEIRDSKHYVEDVTGAPCHAFCYPGGAYEARHQHMVADAGFRHARTITRLVTDHRAADPFALPTTMHCFPHYPDAARIAALIPAPRQWYRAITDWVHLAKLLYTRTSLTGGVFHIWGHSWEINQRDEWAQIERLYAYLAAQPNATFTTNTGAAERITAAHASHTRP